MTFWCLENMQASPGTGWGWGMGGCHPACGGLQCPEKPFQRHTPSLHFLRRFSFVQVLSAIPGLSFPLPPPRRGLWEKPQTAATPGVNE